MKKLRMDPNHQIGQHNKKLGKKKVPNGEVLKSSLNNVAEELREGNSMIQQYKTEEEIFKELVDIGIEKEYIEDCYLFLIQNTDKSRAFFGFPSEMRKSILSKMMAAIVNNLKSIFFGKIEAVNSLIRTLIRNRI